MAKLPVTTRDLVATDEEEIHCSRLGPMTTSDRMESETGGADDVPKIKTNDNQGWNGIRNRSEPLCRQRVEGT